MRGMRAAVIWIRPLRLPICLLGGLLTAASFRLGNLQISWLAVIAVVFGACATMLQNDWCDKYHDLRKKKVLASQYPKAFFTLLLVFWVIVFSLILMISNDNLSVGMLLTGMAAIGLIHPALHAFPMAPVILTAIASGSPALLAVAAGADGIKPWLLFLSATLIIFGREITKDIDDCWIDSGYKWTIPLAVGNKRSKIIAVVAIISGFIFAIGISMSVIPAFIPAIAWTGLLLANSSDTKAVRIFIDASTALAIMVLLIPK